MPSGRVNGWLTTTLLPVDHFLSYSCIKNQSKEELRNDRKRMHRI